MNERKYVVQFVRVPGFARNREDRGAFTKTFSTIDEIVRFNANSSNIRIKGKLIDYFTPEECKIFWNKYVTLVGKLHKRNK